MIYLIIAFSALFSFAMGAIFTAIAIKHNKRKMIEDMAKKNHAMEAAVMKEYKRRIENLSKLNNWTMPRYDD